MAVRSAGILLYRRTAAGLELFLAHMGGPFWAKKEAGAWSIPKGEYAETEDALAAALREFEEEIGTAAPTADYVTLGEFRQSSGKVVTMFAAESDLEVEKVVSNTFPLEWPPRSGRVQQFPEIDAADWFPIDTARTKLVRGQIAVLDALASSLAP